MAGLSSFFLEINESYQNTEKSAETNLRTTITQTSRILEYLYRTNNNENQIQTLVSQLGSHPGYLSAIIFGESNRVEQSNDFRQKGAAISETQARGYGSEMDKVRESQAGTILYADNNNRLVALYPILLGSRIHELKSSRIGVLFVEYDLEGIKQHAFTAALNRALITNISLITLCLLIWIFFEFALNKRIQKLVTATNDLGEGNLDSRSILSGSDELAHVSAAFDNMAEKMQINSKKLEKQATKEKLLRETNDRIRQSLELNTILDNATKDILDYLQADRVAVFKFIAGTNFKRGRFVAASANSGVDSILNLEDEDQCFTPKIVGLYLNGRTNVINDVRTADLATCYRELLEKYSIVSNAVFPLVNAGRLWGLLCIHHCKEPREWSKEDVEFITYVAGQIGIAIQQSSLFTQVQLELSDKKIAEEKLIQTNKQLATTNIELARATRLKDEFLATMSHELRTPLNGILGMAESLDANVYGSLTAKQSTALREITDCGQHLLSLINDILDITKIEAGKLQTEPQPTFIPELCSSCLTTVKQLMASKMITLDSDIQPDIPLCMIDPRLIKQILINLLSNAIKFTPPGGRITMSSRLENKTHDKSTETQLVFEVKDTGIGIDLQNREKIFMPFIQIESSLNRQYGGTGLGLSIVKKIVEAMGGSIRLDSELGKGSSFKVKLPFQAAAVPHHRVPASLDPSTQLSDGAMTGPEQSARSHHKTSILLAEDNRDNSLMYLRYLKAKGYNLTHASNGQQAVEIAASQPIDILILDMSMPELDGFEVMRRLRGSTESRIAQIPIIVLTAMAMKGDRERCLSAGADEYLSKPVKLNQLDIAIKQILANGTKR
ncbi:MAG: ATP-binding protein [Prochlorococcaceae cyanobacterium]